jgi:hypothetical protein
MFESKEQKIRFHDWLKQFIKESGYEIYYNPTDGGEYRIITTDDEVYYERTYEYNNWLKRKYIEFKNK